MLILLIIYTLGLISTLFWILWDEKDVCLACVFWPIVIPIKLLNNLKWDIRSKNK